MFCVWLIFYVISALESFYDDDDGDDEDIHTSLGAYGLVIWSTKGAALLVID